MIKFTAELVPVPFKRVMTCGKQRYNDRRYSDFKKELGYIAKIAMGGREPLTGALKLHADFYKKRKNPHKKGWGDVDNFLKAVMDALNGICYVDDVQVMKVSGTKNFGEPRIEISLEELT